MDPAPAAEVDWEAPKEEISAKLEADPEATELQNPDSEQKADPTKTNRCAAFCAAFCTCLAKRRRGCVHAFLAMDIPCRMVAGFALFQVMLGFILGVTGLIALYYAFPDFSAAASNSDDENTQAAAHAEESIDRYRDTAVLFGLVSGPLVLLNSLWGFLAAHKRSRLGLLLHSLFCAALMLSCAFGAFLPFEISQTFQSSCEEVQARCCDMGTSCSVELDWHAQQFSQSGSCADDITHSCPAGGFWHAPSAACVKCLPGNFKKTAGPGCCKPCSSGSFSTSENTTHCVQCSKGCPAGEFGSSESGVSSCSRCPAGRFKAKVGSGCCRPCGAGEESTSDGAACVPAGGCTKGFYRKSGTCTSCPSGKYSSVFAGLSFCSYCPKGWCHNL